MTAGSTDSFIGTEKSDSITGTNATYQNGDIIIDTTTTDNDILTLNTTANIAAIPTVSGIERIVVNAEKIGTFTFDAQNISSANSITVNRLDLMDGAIDGAGAVTISNAKATNFVAGDKVTAFTVNMDAITNIATAATIDATASTGTVTVSNIGYAGTTITSKADNNVTLTGAAASKATVITSGEVTLTNAAAAGVADVTLEALDASTFTVTGIRDSLTIAGDADVTLKMAATDLTGKKIVNESTGAVNVHITDDVAADLTKVAAVTSVVLDVAAAAKYTKEITVNSDQLITSANDATLEISNVTGATSGTARFAVLDNGKDAAVDIGVANIGKTVAFDSIYLDATADKLTATSLNANDADVVLTGTEDIDLGNVTGALSITSSSTGNITLISNGGTPIATATAYEQSIITGAGDDVVEVNAATTAFAVNLGNGKNELTITDAAADSQFVTGAGDDTVTIAAAAAVIVNTGAGDDKVTLGANTLAHTISLGNGNDTLSFAGATTATIALGNGNNVIKALAGDAASLTGATVTGNVSEVNLAGNLSISSAQFNEFGAFALTGKTGVLTIDATTATKAQTIDASAITLGYNVGATVAIKGSAFGDTITGTIGADTITLGAAGKTDTINFIANGGNDTITGFVTTEDKLSFDGVVAGLTATTGTAVTAGGVTAGALTDNTINVISNGATALTSGGLKTISDYKNLTEVAAYLAEGFTSTVAGDAAVFVINDVSNNKTYAYSFLEDATALTISAAELTLIGVITEGTSAALVAGDIA